MSKRVVVHCVVIDDQDDSDTDQYLEFAENVKDNIDWGDEDVIDKIQDQIDITEGKGYCIDSGGDDDDCDLDFADPFSLTEWESFGEKMAKELLANVVLSLK